MSDKKCPNCGACKECGAGGHKPYPYVYPYPWQYVQQPYWYTTTWKDNSVNVSGGSNLGMNFNG